MSGGGFTHSIAGGQGNLVITQFQSPNYVQGVSGWQVTIEGNAEFNNVKVRGEFYGDDFFLNDSGAYFYSAAPGVGDLVASIAAAAGQDPFGAPVGQGFNLYGPDGSVIGLLIKGTQPVLAMRPAGVTQMTLQPLVFSAASNAGLPNELQWLIMSSGKSAAHADAAVQMQGQSADGTVAPFVGIEFGGTGVAVFTPAALQMNVPVVADTWHNITLDAGWTAGAAAPQYRRLPDGNVQVRGQATHSGVTAATNINGSNPVPAAYWPGVTRIYRPPDAGDAAATVDITAAGVFVARASGFTATAVAMDGMYSI